MTNPVSPILAFYLGGADHRGRTLDHVLRQDDAWLEATHDYIQWLFPLPEPSPYNPRAPTLRPADIAAFRTQPPLRSELLRAFGRMQGFYGLPQKAADRSPQWLTPHNHNFLRISRILRCLHLLGCPGEAAAFLAALEALARGHAAISPLTLTYWRAAAQGEQPG